ncbi:MAG: hypothetical protein ACMG6E_10710 [Candidatus Roizmanbacteria bacterium]
MVAVDTHHEPHYLLYALLDFNVGVVADIHIEFKEIVRTIMATIEVRALH